jgi:hypothetical protein
VLRVEAVIQQFPNIDNGLVAIGQLHESTIVSDDKIKLVVIARLSREINALRLDLHLPGMA